ncbi:MAG: DUF4080 domain-containing protein [Candidatus Cloacimonadota bacterium]|nr:DUF4080 domain-containing protein [Candidatus Cloacimonadota bacterium]
MEKVLLVAINARYRHSNLAIRYLRNYNNDLNYRIELLETSLKQDRQTILSAIYHHHPDIIGFSVYIWNSNIYKLLIADVKKVLPNCKIILGGPEVTYSASFWLEEFKDIDYIVKGAGEEGFRYILTNWPTEKIVCQPNPEFQSLPFPYLPQDFLELDSKYIYYETSRGCPFNCSYCLSSRQDDPLRYRSWQQIKEELTYLICKNPKIIKFVDRTFNANRKLSRKIWQFLLDKETTTKFHFEIHPNLLGKEDFDLLQQAKKNKFQFEIGIQTTNLRTLKAINRAEPYQRENVKKLIEMKKFHIHVDLIVGLPYEGIVSLQNTFNNVHSLGADHLQVGFLKILAGTKMAEQKEEFQLQYQQNAPYKILQNRWLSYEEINLLESMENIQNLLYNSGNFSTLLFYAIPLFESAFHFYKNITENWKNIPVVPRNWQKVAYLLYLFFKKNLPHKLNLILDTMRWDWCKLASGHYYPDFLANHKLVQAKKYGFNYLKQQLQSWSRTDFTYSQLRQAIFFQKSSTEFHNCQCNEIVCFLPNGKKIKFQ